MKPVTMMPLCAALVLLAAAPAALAQATKPAETITRVYDTRDLTISVRDFPFTGTMGMPSENNGPMMVPGTNQEPMMGGPAPTTRPAREQREADLVRLISDTVAPESWRDAGGTVGAIRMIGGQMIITQTEDAHRMIQSILQQLRDVNGVIRVQADWLLLSLDQLNALAAKPQQGAAAPKVKLLDPQQLAKLAPDVVRYHADLSCFGGQTISVSSGRARSVVYDLEPVVAQNAAAAKPDIRQVQEGAMLEVTALRISGSDEAVVEVHSRVAQFGEPGTARVYSSSSTTQPGDRSLLAIPDTMLLDKLNIVSQDLRSTLRMPRNVPVLIGGMTLDPNFTTPQAPQLYLVLQVSDGGR